MSTETYSNSYSEVSVSFRFKDNLDAETWNNRLKGVLGSGVYQITSPLISILSDTSVRVNEFVALLENPNVSFVESVNQTTIQRDLLTKIEARTTKDITGIDYTKPYIVVEFEYSQSQSVTPNVKNVAYSEIDSTKHLVLGKCLYRDDAGTKDELYDIDTVRSFDKSVMYEVEDWFNQFIGVVSGDKQITVNGGLLEGEEVDSLVIDYGNQSGETALPADGFHRYDLVYVDAANTMQLRVGEEEADAGEDEYPKPDKISLALYDFPVCYIYVSENLTGTRVFQPTDIENIIPRFMKKYQVLSGSLSDIIIASQTDCDAYFGTNSTDDQGGTTPGLYDDGFVCEYENSVKSVYIPDKRIVFKNQFDVNGNSIPYEIYNRVLLQSNSEIYSSKDVLLKYMRTFARFETIDQTNLVVDEYTPSKFEVLSEDSKYIDPSGENYGDQVVLTDSDNLFAFSDTPGICKKYDISEVVKNIKEDISLQAAGATWGSFNNIEIQNTSNANVSTEYFHAIDFYYNSKTYVMAFYEIHGTPDNVGYALYEYNSATNVLDKVGANDSAFGATTFSGVTDIRLGASADNIHVILSTSSGIVHAYQSMLNIVNSLFDLGNIVTIPTTAGDTKNDLYVTSDNYVYISTKDSSHNLDFLKSSVNFGAYTFTSVTSIDSGLGNTNNTSIMKNGNNILISYGKTAARTTLYLAYSSNNGTSFNTAELDNGGGSDHCGFHSKIIMAELSETGSNEYYVAYNYNSAKDTVKFAEIDMSGSPALSSKETIINESGTSLDYLDLKLNTDNLYPTSSGLVQVIAWNQTNYSGLFPLYSANSINNATKSWSENYYSMGEFDNHGYLTAIFNDYIFIAYYNNTADAGSYDDNNYLLKLYYNFEVSVTPTITPLNLTDVRISPDFAENVYLEVDVDGNQIGSGSNPAFRLGNSVDTTFKVRLSNSNHFYAALGEGTADSLAKTFGANIDLDYNEKNTANTIVRRVNHSTFLHTDIKSGSAYTLRQCLNININGRVDGISQVGNGDYDF